MQLAYGKKWVLERGVCIFLCLGVPGNLAPVLVLVLHLGLITELHTTGFYRDSISHPMSSQLQKKKWVIFVEQKKRHFETTILLILAQFMCVAPICQSCLSCHFFFFFRWLETVLNIFWVQQQTLGLGNIDLLKIMLSISDCQWQNLVSDPLYFHVSILLNKFYNQQRSTAR